MHCSSGQAVTQPKQIFTNNEQMHKHCTVQARAVQVQCRIVQHSRLVYIELQPNNSANFGQCRVDGVGISDIVCDLLLPVL